MKEYELEEIFRKNHPEYCSGDEVEHFDLFLEGYNKANEWHYVKDGKYPIECVSCLLYLSDNVNPITGWRHRGVWYFADNRDLEKWQDKVIAWKEIVLPELKKSV